MESLESLSRDELIRIVLEQHRLIQQLQSEVEQLKKRGGAAPFSKGKHKADAKPPGRKPGQGFFRFRTAPEEKLGVEAVAVPVKTPCCPDCGGQLGQARQEIVSITDIPAQPQPEVRRYAIEVRRCRNCGGRVRGSHPDVAPGQHGATAHRLGPRIRMLAHLLHYVHGVPVRKTPAIVEELTGVRLTQGAITQDALKQAEGAVGARYEALRRSVREQSMIHTDDTGWRVGGETAFLMAFVNPSLSVYQVRSRHRNEEVRELIPSDFKGVMVCDRGKSYDAEELENVAQQKCLAHLIRNAIQTGELKQGHGRRFSRELAGLLRQALEMAAVGKGLRTTAWFHKAMTLHDQLTMLLRPRVLRDTDNQRLLNGAAAQHDRGRLLRFLAEDDVEATNNRAERDLRPAVIGRKVSHCSKNQRGARAFEAFTSVLQTLRKTITPFTADTLTQLISPLSTPS